MCLLSQKFLLLLHSQSPTGPRDLPQQPLRQKKLTRSGTCRRPSLYCLPCRFTKPAKIKFLTGLARVEKSCLPLHPASIGGGNGLKSEPRKNKNFPLSLATSKVLLTFALPIEKKGKRKERKRADYQPHCRANWATHTFFE